MFKRSIFLLLLFLNLSGFGQTKNALFIGNSYIYYNTLPQLVASIASSAGKSLTWDYSAPGGYTLEQHSNNSTTLGKISAGGWDYVIFQEFSQYPSELLSTVQVYVYPYASYLTSLAKSYNPGSKTMFFMTWGRRNGDADRCARLPEVCTYEGMDNLTRERYMFMGQANQSEVSPVGAVWRYIRENFPSIELYTSDGSHPSEAGSYAAACTFYTAIFRSDPTQATYDFTLTPDVASNIRQAAKTIVYNSLSSWYIGNYDSPDNEAPTVPTGFTYSNLTQSGVTLNWSASTDNIGVIGYNVYQNQAQITIVTNTTVNISGLDAVTTYTFTIKARDAAGNLSGSSSGLTITTPDSQAPTVPTGFSTSNLTETGFTLNWLSSTDNVGVTGYEVYQNGSYLSIVTSTSTAITGLSPSTTYSMTARARDAAGNYSALSTIYNVTTPDTHAPSVPSGLTSNNITQTSFTLTWSASTDNVGVTGYNVYLNGTYQGTVTGTTMGISGLNAGTTYAMTVSARDATGNISASSAVLNVTTLNAVIPDTQAPSVPTGLTSESITAGSFILKWNASTDNIGVAGYDVYRNSVYLESVTGTSAAILGLSPGTTYSMTVRAKDAAGNISSPSTALNVTTLVAVIPDVQAPTVPTALASSNITQTGFALSWTASADNVGVTGYDVYADGLLTTSVTTTATNLTGLTSSTTYVMTVRARDDAGNISDASAPLNVTTLNIVVPDLEDPSAPTGVAASNITESGFDVSWNASSDNIGVVGYDIFLNGTLARSVSTTSTVFNTLDAATAYSVTVVAHDAAGNTSAASSPVNVTTLSIVLPDVQPPTVPNGLSSGSITETSFMLNWSPSTDDVGVTGYNIYENGSYLNTTSNTTLPISGLSAGSTYIMTVRALDAAGNISAASSGLSVTTADTHAPVAPAGLNVTGLTQTGFTLNWTSSTDNVGVNGYQVYRNGVLYITIIGTSASITGLSASTSYSMTVRATDAAGNVSPLSTVLVVTTPDTQAPTAPSGLASSNLAQSSFTLSWIASTDNVGVTGYDVYLNGGFINSVTGTSIGISGLSASTTYSMTVRARDAAQNVSTSSSALNVTTLDSQAPTTPANLTSSNLTQSSVTISWTASTDNVAVTGYYVYRNGNQVSTVTTTSAAITGLSASTSYIFTVRARDAAGNLSPISAGITIVTPDTQAPSVPNGLGYTNLTQTSFTITWNPSTDNVGVTGYNVYRDGTQVVSVSGTAAGITGLLVARTYAMTIRAKDAAGNVSSASAVLNITTPDTEGPTTPTGVTYSNLTQSGFTLSWTASTDNVGVTGYEVYHQGSLLKTATGTTTTLTGLEASKTYLITVRARDASGNKSVPSNVLSVTTPDTEAPTVPTGLQYISLAQNGFTLKWNPATDNVGVTEYEVFKNGSLFTKVSVTTAAISGLSASVTYSMTVKAKDAAGNTSTASAPLNVTTPDTEAPTVPEGLVSENLTETGFTMRWQPSTDNVAVSGYEVFKDGEQLTLVTDTVAEITGLTAYGAYSMTLRARDAAGNKSDTSNALIVRTLDVHPPTAPTGLVAWNITDSTLSLGWMASEDNVSVLQYDVYSNGLLAESTADTSIDFTGLNPLTEFLITVIARDPAGNPSPASTALYIVTPDTREPDAPNGLISDKIKHNSFRLIWNTPWDNVGVSEYMVYRNDMLVSTVSDTMAFITGLKANTTYLMTVRAEDASGNVSEMSDTLEVTTDFPGADATITLFPNPVTDNTLNIDLGSENCTETLVEILDMEGNLMVKQMVDGTNRLITFTVDDLSPGIYILHVRCNGNSYSKKLMIGAIY